MRTNHVLIDWENVQPASLGLLDREDVRVHVFTGALQKDILLDKAAALQPMGKRAQYIRMARSGRNALDFHIAFYIGQLSVKDETAFFHIISKDKDFDPLIEHLKSKKILCARSVTVDEMPFVKLASAKTPAARMAIVLDTFPAEPEKRPGTLKTLSSAINTRFSKSLSEEEVTAVIAALETGGHVSMNGTKVMHHSP
jgi:hypothetical protein